MALRNSAQNRQLWAIVNQLKIDKEQVEELAFQYSQGRTKSTRELSVQEFSSLVNHLEAIKKGMVKASEVKQKLPDPADRQRKKFLSTCYDLKWTTNGKLNWIKINEWLQQYGYLHKPLNDYTLQELPKLVTQIETLLKKDYAKR